jgi:hypothetical protein
MNLDNGMPLKNKRVQSTEIAKKMDEFQVHYAEKEGRLKGKILYNFLYAILE